MILQKTECLALHQKNAGKLVWLDYLAENDTRIIIRNSDETLHIFMSAEFDPEEQAQAARLCAALNMQRSFFAPKSKIL